MPWSGYSGALTTMYDHYTITRLQFLHMGEEAIPPPKDGHQFLSNSEEDAFIYDCDVGFKMEVRKEFSRSRLT